MTPAFVPVNTGSVATIAAVPGRGACGDHPPRGRLVPGDAAHVADRAAADARSGRRRSRRPGGAAGTRAAPRGRTGRTPRRWTRSAGAPMARAAWACRPRPWQGRVPVDAGVVPGYGWRAAVPDRRVTGSGRPSARRGRESAAPAVGV